MLIKCPECGSEISDKSDKCVHCGYPIKHEKVNCCIIENKEYDLSSILSILNDPMMQVLIKIRQITSLQIKDAQNLYKIIKANNCIPEIFVTESEVGKSQPKCPFCQSSNVHKITGTERAASVVGLGLFSKKINKSFKCNRCGGTF